MLNLTHLKGKFSSGIEGALGSTLNHDFNWKQLSEMILCIILLMFSKFEETLTLNFGRGRRTLL